MKIHKNKDPWNIDSKVLNEGGSWNQFGLTEVQPFTIRFKNQIMTDSSWFLYAPVKIMSPMKKNFHYDSLSVEE